MFLMRTKRTQRRTISTSFGPNILRGQSLPGSHPNAGCFFIASMNASKSLGFSKVHALRLMSMLRLGLMVMGIGVDDRMLGIFLYKWSFCSGEDLGYASK
jgi:hypothetical protein